MHPEILIYDSHVAPSMAVIQRSLNYKNLPVVFGGTQKPTNEISILGNISMQVAMAAIDGKAYYDVGSFVSALESIVPAPSFWPDNSANKATAALMMDWFDQSFFWHVMALRWGNDSNAKNSFKQVSGVIPAFIRPFMFPFAKRMIRKKITAQGLGLLSEDMLLSAMDKKLAGLAEMLEASDYLLGDKLSIADIYLCSYLEFALQGTIPQLEGMAAAFPQLGAHSERVIASTGMPIWPEDEEKKANN